MLRVHRGTRGLIAAALIDNPQIIEQDGRLIPGMPLDAGECRAIAGALMSAADRIEQGE